MPRTYPVRVEFGKGNISVMTCHDEISGIEHVVAFAIRKKSHPIGEEDLSNVGKTIAEIKPIVVFEFSKSASVQVVIDKLVIVRDSLAAFEKQYPTFVRSVEPVLIVSGKYPEPESQVPDQKDGQCACFEKVGDNPSCRVHDHGGLAS